MTWVGWCVLPLGLVYAGGRSIVTPSAYGDDPVEIVGRVVFAAAWLALYVWAWDAVTTLDPGQRRRPLVLVGHRRDRGHDGGADPRGRGGGAGLGVRCPLAAPCLRACAARPARLEDRAARHHRVPLRDRRLDRRALSDAVRAQARRGLRRRRGRGRRPAGPLGAAVRARRGADDRRQRGQRLRQRLQRLHRSVLGARRSAGDLRRCDQARLLSFRLCELDDHELHRRCATRRRRVGGRRAIPEPFEGRPQSSQPLQRRPGRGGGPLRAGSSERTGSDAPTGREGVQRTRESAEGLRGAVGSSGGTAAAAPPQERRAAGPRSRQGGGLRRSGRRRRAGSKAGSGVAQSAAKAPAQRGARRGRAAHPNGPAARPGAFARPAAATASAPTTALRRAVSDSARQTPSEKPSKPSESQPRRASKPQSPPKGPRRSGGGKS